MDDIPFDAISSETPLLDNKMFLYQSFNQSEHGYSTVISTVLLEVGMRELVFFSMVVLAMHCYLSLIRRLCPLPMDMDEEEARRTLDSRSMERRRRSSDGSRGRRGGRAGRTPVSGLTESIIDERIPSFTVGERAEALDMSKEEFADGDNIEPLKHCVVHFGQDVCAICLEELDGGNDDERLRSLMCDHVFHQGKSQGNVHPSNLIHAN